MTTHSARPHTHDPGSAFTHVVSTALEAAAAKLTRKTEQWVDRLDEIAEGGGATQQAEVKAAQAGLQGKNPVWGAVKGAWSGGGAAVKAAIVAALVSLLLLALLSPVVALVFLLSLLVIAAVAKTRSAKK